MKKDDHVESFKRLQHILEAIAEIQKYVQDQSLTSFCQSGLIHDAVLYQFSVIGEAIIHVEDEKLNMYDYPWHKVRSFRNMIAHEYFNVKLIAVWAIIQNDLPELNKVVEQILDNEF
ncbi:MAG: HepT-like ribonuclease domain-containing protein [Bacteroidia bacterium]